MNGDIVPTGIGELDRLLGGGLPRTGTVLLRGGPGSGKTTLCLQILYNILAGHPGSMGVYVSLEVEPAKAVRHMKNAYGKDLRLFRDGHFATLSHEELCARRGHHPRQVKVFVNSLLDKLARLQVDGAWPKIIVVDSLSVLVNLFRDARGNVKDVRGVLHDLMQAAATHFAMYTLVFCGECDPSSPRAASLLGESFFSDVEIVLSSERVPAHSRPPETVGPRAEQRFFCEVRKARELPRLVQRCSYDFETGKGLVFYETFPGDGRIVVFQENLPMREEWRIFRRRDIPDLYPCLGFDTFDRSGLQRTFASQRRLRSIPQRTNMTLHSFDTYWINWYAELCQRWDIAMTLKAKPLHCAPSSEKEKHERFSVLVGKVHRFCNDCMTTMASACSRFATVVGDQPNMPLRNALVEALDGGQTPFVPGGARETLVARPRVNAFVEPHRNRAYAQLARMWRHVKPPDSFLFDYHLMWDLWSDGLGKDIGNVMARDVKDLKTLGLNGLVSVQCMRAFYPLPYLPNAMADTLWDRTLSPVTHRRAIMKAAFGPHAREAEAYFASMVRAFRMGGAYEHCTACRDDGGASPRALARLAALAERYRKRFEALARGERDPVVRTSLGMLAVHADHAETIARVRLARLTGDAAGLDRVRARYRKRRAKALARFAPWIDPMVSFPLDLAAIHPKLVGTLEDAVHGAPKPAD